MKSSSVFVISLLLLSILVHEAQGIRLDKNGSLSAKLHKFQEDILRNLKKSMDLEGTNLRCNGKNSCLESSSGRNRKLMMMTNLTTTNTSSTTTDSKTHSSIIITNQKAENTISSSHDHNSPNMLDLAGMDYSPASRKPPIHN